MKKIALFVNSADMMQTAKEAVKSAKEEIHLIATDTYEESLQNANILKDEGYHLFIARGGHAQRLRDSGLGIPVVQIPFTGNNIAAMLIQASRNNDQFAVIGSPILIRTTKELEPFLSSRIYTYAVKNWQDFDEQIEYAKSLGIRIVMGGYDASKIAISHGLTPFTITTNLFEIRSAIKDAENLLAGADRDQRWNVLFRSVLDTISEGVVIVDSDHKITHINKRARKFMGDCSVGFGINDPVFVERLKRVQDSDKGIYDELTEEDDYKFSSTVVPVHTGDSISEIITIMQEIEYVRKVEQKVRQKVAQKGFVASHSFSDILGDSQATRATIQTAKRFASVHSTVLITGESGTGKELYAQGIHNYSQRQNEAFVAVNCATIAPSLLESELFGYAEGAFTGAKRGGRAGLFEMAQNGTIFLDEIGETSLEVQARLLRVLEEHQIMRVGDDRVIPVNIRVIAATNQDLQKMVEKGTFRSDFYYRLNVLSLSLKPLRERREDIPPQIDFFNRLFAVEHGRDLLRFTDSAIMTMVEYPWRGNTRELKNVIERLVVTNTGVDVSAEEAREAIGIPDTPAPREGRLMDTAEFDMIRYVLAETKGNKTQAAKRLGISRPTLLKKLRQMEGE